MAQEAKITSIDALDQFRSSLLNYIEKASISLHEASEDVMRTRVWLRDQQLPGWKNEIRRVKRELEDAQQALFSAEMSSMRGTPGEEQMMVRRAREKMRHTEAKLKITKKHDRDYDSHIEPLAKQVEQLRSIVTQELPKAVQFLNNASKALEAYADVHRPVMDPARQQKSATPADTAKETPNTEELSEE